MTTTTMESMETRLWVLMSDKLGLEKDQIKMSDSFTDDLGVDSLDVIELFTNVEKEFEIKISDEDAEKLTTVGAVIDYITQHTH